MGIPELAPLPPPKVHFQVITPSLSFGPVWPGETPSAVLEATAEGCDAFRLGLHLPPGREGFSLSRERANGAEVHIPTTWRLRWNTGHGWTEWLEPSLPPMPAAAEPMLWWDVGEAGRGGYQLQLECKLNMAPMQLAGDYKATIRFTAIPVLQFSAEQFGVDAPEIEPGGIARPESGGLDADRKAKRTYRSKGVRPVPRGPTARWQRRSAVEGSKWTRRSHMP